MSDVPTKLMTADELFALPNDNMRHELIDGELTTMTPEGGEHGSIIVNLTVQLGHYVKAQKLGRVFSADTGFILKRNADTVLAPDVSFVKGDRFPSAGVTKKFIPLAPDLVVEVISPSDTVDEVAEKTGRWLGSGVRLVWIVSPRHRNVTVHPAAKKPFIVTENETLDGSDVVPGFSMPVCEIFD